MNDTSHKAASRTLREIASWQPGRGSADSDLLPELDTIVARSRDLSRNHGIASGAMQTLADNIVGTGFRLSVILHFCMNKETQVWTIKDNYRLGADIQSKVLAFALNICGN